ncbi:NAD-dependent epimerase/dehydratase family protein [Candidatus Micrarchaeota archaeon]|nr:NAD-dependent epimerase/dehydratase family protein [Candidatus Micrarchaeota archaeon]
MKILVTGATGHVGKHLVPALLEEEHSVRVAVLNAEEAREAFNDAPLEIMQLDFESAEQPAFDTIAKGVDAVVHLAAIGVADPSISREKIFAVNVKATEKLLQACKKNAGFKRFVFISSSALYHDPKKIPIEEEDAPSPGNAYGESKLAAEKAVRESGVPFVILRPVVIYGLGFEPAFAPIVNAIQKQKLPVIGDGNARFAVVHVEDFVNAILLSLKKKEAAGQAFNVSGEALSQKQWLAAIADELGVQPPKKRIPVWLAEAIALFYELKGKIFGKGQSAISRESVRRLTTDRVFSTKKAEKLLGWKPKVDYRDGLNEIISSIMAKK